MAEDLFKFTDYREYIKAQIERSDQSWGLISKISQALQCQRSQLSRVISGHINLSMDQGYDLCRFWRLNELETSYFLKLLEYARSGKSQYREKLLRDMAQIRSEQENLSDRLQQSRVEKEEMESFYYSTWYWTAVHILSSIPEYQTAKKISEHLSLPLETVTEVLNKLFDFQVVRRIQDRSHERWEFKSKTTHLPKGSPWVSIHHSNWRQRAVMDSQNQKTDGIHYTAVQSIARKDFLKLKQVILSTIDEYNRIASPSKEEELISFTCDFFRVR